MKLAITHLVLSTATFGLMLAVPQNAQAAGLIPNVAATVSNAGVAQTGNIGFTVDGAGLIGPPVNKPTLTGDHGASSNTNSWRSSRLDSLTPPGLAGITINFAFNRVYSLAGFSFWNSGGSISTTPNTVAVNQGIKNVTIEYSSDGGTTWVPLTGAPSSFNPGPLLGDVSPQLVSFKPVYATNVKFSNMSTQGTNNGLNNRLGFNEIQFRSIPEPSTTLALLALGLAGVGLRKRI
ncbi:PEP-CTERM sorting domain-containing protein [Microcystis aeruginosa]|uniref:PEP-CTERM sorting domain-containing protein n=1 Tax=Microcystis aeruginosa TaxID=1126 RepID=UPI0012314669|nr:PEP-CTERM sorting domain-containing protein [Microcystis aeruginosa]GCA86797.1 hypothetical protein MiTa_00121 [Microcystis aeruginosa NIES-4264]